MELLEFTAKMKEQFIDCDTIRLESDTDFRTIDSFDSLTGMAILMMIEEVFSQTINEDVFRSLKTPKQVFDHLTK